MQNNNKTFGWICTATAHSITKYCLVVEKDWSKQELIELIAVILIKID